MNKALIFMLAGMILATAIAAGGFLGFLLALVFGSAGFLLGGQLDGDLDLGALVRNRRE